MTRPPMPDRAPPEGHHFEALEEDTRIMRFIPPALARPCRQRVGQGHDHRTCKAPSVAAFNRPRSRHDGRPTLDSWWHYCPDHLYGRWVEDEKVLTWGLVDDEVGTPIGLGGQRSPAEPGVDTSRATDHGIVRRLP